MLQINLLITIQINKTFNKRILILNIHSNRCLNWILSQIKLTLKKKILQMNYLNLINRIQQNKTINKII